MKKNRTIYYWASSEKKNNGEGILARNFLHLLRRNFKNYTLQPLNSYKKINQNTFFYKYILPFLAILILWKHFFLKQKISYVNFLPAWNIVLILLLPPRTILGPVTGSINKIKFRKTIKFFSFIGLKIINYRFKRILFSHDFFKKFLDNEKKKYFFNFLLYNFKISNNINKKKYDLIFYYRKHHNKNNLFNFLLLNKLSKKFKICVIGERINIKSSNILNKGFVSRNKAIKYIKETKSSIASYENLFSYFALDCISNNLTVFYNKEFIVDKKLKINSIIPIDFYNLEKTLRIISNNVNNTTKNKINIRSNDFNDYLKDL